MNVVLAIVLCLLACVIGFLAGTWHGGHKFIEQLDAARDLAVKYERWARLYDVWMMTKKYGMSIEEYLLGRDIHEIAIYGMGLFGIRLYHELKDTRIRVAYGMGRDPQFQTPGLTIYTEWDATKRPVDAVIVTAFLAYPSIEPELVGAGYRNVMSIDELLYGLL